MSIELLSACVMALGGAAIGVMARRGQDKGTRIFRALPRVLGFLGLIGLVALAAENHNLALTVLVIAATISAGAAAVWVVEEDWDPVYNVAAQAAVSAGFLAIVGGHQPWAVAMATVLASFAGAVFAPMFTPPQAEAVGDVA